MPYEFADQETLHFVAARQPQQVRLFPGLDPFDHHRESKIRTPDWWWIQSRANLSLSQIPGFRENNREKT